MQHRRAIGKASLMWRPLDAAGSTPRSSGVRAILDGAGQDIGHELGKLVCVAGALGGVVSHLYHANCSAYLLLIERCVPLPLDPILPLAPPLGLESERPQ
jgi:hypothetical protein